MLNYLLEERVDYDRSLDVTGDGVIARDALNVVNYLNRYGNGTFVPNQETLSYFPSLERSTDTAAPLADGSAVETTGTWLDERRSKRLGDWFPVLSPVEADPAVDAFLASI